MASGAAVNRPPELSVVIPVHNGVPLLADQLEAIAAEQVDGGFEVVVVDNNSTDDTRSLAEGFADRLDLRVIDCLTPGVSAARNAGVAVARGGKVVFLDDDDRIRPGYLQHMTRALDEHEFVASRVGVDRLNPGGVSRDIPQATGLGEGWRPWAYGATIGIRAHLYRDLGGCDEELRFAGEDIDLCWRLALYGATLVLVPHAVLDYRVRNSPSQLFRQGRDYGRGGAQVERRFAPHGHRPTSIRRELVMLAKVAVRLSGSRGKVERGRYAFLLGRRIGVLMGRLRRDECRDVAPDGQLIEW